MTIDLLTDLPDASITAYYRASDVTLNGSDVSQLDDLSGGGKHFTQGTAANQPVYNSSNSAFNNKPTIDPVAASSEFMRASTLSLGTTFTVVVIGAAGSGADQAVLGEGNTADDGYVGFDGANHPVMDNGVVLTGSNSANLLPAIFEFRVNGASSLVRDKAVEDASGTLGTANTWSDIYLFSRDDGTYYFNGVAADILIVSGSLTQADRRVIHQYAKERYNIAFPFPQYSAGVETNFTSTTQIHNVNLEDDIEKDDLIVVFSVFDKDTPDLPSGYTRLASNSVLGDKPFCDIFIKIADGTEGGGTVNLQTDTDNEGCAGSWRIRDWYGAVGGVEAGSWQATVADDPNPPSLTVTWGALKNLWMAFAGSDTIINTGPSGYSGIMFPGYYNLPASTDVFGGAGFKESEAASENPGAFGAIAIDECLAITIGIRPIAAADAGGGAGILAAGL